MEEWKDIDGFEGLYQISSEGKVKSLWFGKEKILKGEIIRSGYLLVQLYKDGKRTLKLIHRLVAKSFIPNPNSYEQVNHKDECKTNNSVSNLEWCDRKYNVNYGSRTQKCTEKLLNRQDLSKRVDQINPQTGEVVRQWESTQECGRNGFDSSNVSACARGLRKTHKGYIWKFAPM